jgi:L-fuculose-phosphate aldolase
MACLHWEIPAVHYLVAFSGRKVPLATYAIFGSEELAAHVAATIGDYNAVLLANHGLVTVGPNLATAFAVAEEIELVARIYYQAKCIGEPVIVPRGDVKGNREVCQLWPEGRRNPFLKRRVTIAGYSQPRLVKM